MKKLFLISVFICFTILEIPAQWLEQDVPSGWAGITNITGVGNEILYVKGTGSNIKRKFGDGNFVSVNNSSDFAYLYFFRNSLTGFSSNENWTKKTTDGGYTWKPFSVYSLDEFILNKSFFINDSFGFLIGTIGDANIEDYVGCAYKITSQSATKTTFDGTSVAIDIFFIDSILGFIAVDNRLFKTSNSGESWTDITNFPGTQGAISAIHFVNTNVGYVFKDVYIKGIFKAACVYKTLNGGQEWDSILTLSDYYTKDMIFIDSINGFVIGYGINGKDKLFFTNDAGNNWQDTGFSFNTIYNLDCPSNNLCYICGNSSKYYVNKNPRDTTVSINDGKSNYLKEPLINYDPSTSNIILEFEEVNSNVSLELYSIDGKKLEQISIKTNPDYTRFKIYVGNYSKGIHIVRIFNNQLYLSKKIIIY